MIDFYLAFRNSMLPSHQFKSVINYNMGGTREGATSSDFTPQEEAAEPPSTAKDNIEYREILFQ